MKSKFFIIPLAIFFVFAASYVAFSWQEPDGTMPEDYFAPINTSGIDQEVESKKFVTNLDTDYLDGLDSSAFLAAISAGNAFITNEGCPSGFVGVLYEYAARTCSGTASSCTTTNGWGTSANPPFCLYYDAGVNGSYTAKACQANSVSGARLCVELAEVSGMGDPLLVPGFILPVHYSQECTDAGGEVVVVEGSINICKFTQSTCPSGWFKYKDWSTTTSTCYVYCTGSHTWSNTAVEHVYDPYKPAEIYAQINEVGCY